MKLSVQPQWTGLCLASPVFCSGSYVLKKITSALTQQQITEPIECGQNGLYCPKLSTGARPIFLQREKRAVKHCCLHKTEFCKTEWPSLKCCLYVIIHGYKNRLFSVSGQIVSSDFPHTLTHSVITDHFWIICTDQIDKKLRIRRAQGWFLHLSQTSWSSVFVFVWVSLCPNVSL